MAGGWALSTSVCNNTDYGTQTATSNVSTLTSGGSANTKGSYVQLVASTGLDAVGILVQLCNLPSGANEYSVDIAIGGSGSEVIIVPDLIMQDDHSSADIVWIPVSIPSGTRIAARCQADSGSQVVLCGVSIVDGEYTALGGPNNVDTYGFVSANTTGTVVDPGGTANTKGAYVQLTASTTNDICGLIVAVDPALVTGAASTSANILLDIAVGGSGSEQVIIPNLFCNNIQNNGAINTIRPQYWPFMQVGIPSGTRIAARAQSSLNTATQRTFGVVVYGVRAIN